MKLTTEMEIDRLKVDRRTFISMKGNLYLEATPRGIKRWWFRYKIDGDQKGFELGLYPTLTLKAARALAANARLELKKESGTRVDLKAERDRKRLEKIAQAEEAARQVEIERIKLEDEEALLKARLTFLGLYDRWFKSVVSKHKDKGEYIARLFEKDILPTLGHWVAEDVTRQLISQTVLNIAERGSLVMSGKALTSIRQMYGYGIGIGLVEHDPTSHLKKSAFAGKETPRDRVLSEDELTHLLQVALINSKLSFKGKAAIKIILATAVRVGELLQAKYEHIDLVNRRWIIPEEIAKNGKEHLIHLSDYAVQAFEELFTVVEHDVWLFTDRSKTKNVCVKTLTKQITDRQTNAPLKNRASDTTSLMMVGGKWTPHDLRRTAATLMAGLKVPPYVIEKCLNHTEENKMIKTYQHDPLYEERAQAFDALGRKLSLLSDLNATQNETLIKFNKYR